MPRFRRRSRAERLRDRGDVRRLVRRLDAHEWLVARDGRRTDLALGQRLEAVVALGEIGTEEAQAGVVRALGDGDLRVRRAAVEALRPSPGAESLTAVARAAAHWREPALAELREAAVALLADLGDEAAAVEFARLLVDDSDGSALDAWEEEAVRRLFTADSGPAAELLAGDLTARLASDAGHPAWQTLVAMGGPAVLPLIAALDEPTRRPAVAYALGALRDARAVEPLTGVLAAGDAPARAAAARALGEIRDPRAVQALVTASADEHPDVRDAAMDGLDRMRSIVLAMLGAAARAPAEASGGEPSEVPDAAGEPLPAPAAVGAPLQLPDGVDTRRFVQRLLDR